MAICNPFCSFFCCMVSFAGVVGLLVISTALHHRYRFIGEWFDEGDESLEVCKNVDPDQLEQQDQCVSALQAKANDVAGDINKAIAIFAGILAVSVFSIASHMRAGRV